MIQNIQAHRCFAPISNSLSQNWGKIGIKTLFYSIFILSHEKSMASEVSMLAGQEVAITTLGQVSKVVSPAFEVVSCVNLASQLYNVGKDVISYTFPNKEAQVKNQDFNNGIKFIAARGKFKDCLLANKSSQQKDSLGYPTVCKEVIGAFRMCGGTSEVNDMAVVFNKMRKGQN